MFAPYENVLGYNDSYFLASIPYSILRFAGLNPFAAMEVTHAGTRAVGFFAAWVLMRRYFGLSIPATAFGATLATIANGIYLGTMHTQLTTVAYAPLLFCLIARIHELLMKERRRAALITGCLTGLLLACWPMTSFYTFWMTGLFMIITLCAALVVDSRSVMGIARELTAGHRWLVLVPGLLIFAVGLHPLWLTYGPTAAITGMHQFSAVIHNAPRLVDVINVGPDNPIWSATFESLRFATVGEGIGEFELWRGFTPLHLLLLVLALIGAFKFPAILPTRQDFAFRCLLVGLAVGLVLLIQVGGFTLWGIVYYVVPGAKAVRVIVRFELLLLTFGAIALAIALDAFARYRAPWSSLAAILMGVAVLAEQYSGFPIARVKAADVKALGDIRKPPRECKTFYTINPYRSDGESAVNTKYYIHSTEAMLIAERINLPTLLGMHTFIPPGWDLTDPLSPDYSWRVYEYAKAHDLTDGLCAFDLKSLTWHLVTPPQPPPAAPAPELAMAGLVSPVGPIPLALRTLLAHRYGDSTLRLPCRTIADKSTPLLVCAGEPVKEPADIRLALGLREGEEVSFAGGEAGTLLLADGWSRPESWGTWASGQAATLVFRLVGDDFPDGVRLTLTAHALPRPQDRSKVVHVLVGGAPVATLNLTRDPGPQDLCIPAAQLPKEGAILLTFQTDSDIQSPATLKISDDTRPLNFAVSQLSVSACQPLDDAPK
ncbi:MULTISPECIES: hypothetical protein [unclassified Chelatococcus]|uniref:hypothetical protein n=1 Tax=unclassified Chelatococcus TaxID=2638111 RepID=UPI001BCC7ED8|nr:MULTISPECIES: hypothetical protein [unclassified Chelatococcus]MBS7700967.1 hypothetical protein [Chelatococcus sp. YT9]MBX3555500.1 hypothetical protein [Chelatococcus sp.]